MYSKPIPISEIKEIFPINDKYIRLKLTDGSLLVVDFIFFQADGTAVYFK